MHEKVSLAYVCVKFNAETQEILLASQLASVDLGFCPRLRRV